jgi:hypothetical protein
MAELIVNRAMIDERISFLKEQINPENKPEVNKTFQVQIDTIRSVDDIEKVESIILQRSAQLKNSKMCMNPRGCLRSLMAWNGCSNNKRTDMMTLIVALVMSSTNLILQASLMRRWISTGSKWMSCFGRLKRSENKSISRNTHRTNEHRLSCHHSW